MGFDIVEVMREKAAHTRNIAGDYWGDWMCNVAADDIERLRADLDPVMDDRTRLIENMLSVEAERDALRSLLEEWLRVPCATPEGSSLYPHYAALRNSTTRALREDKNE